MLLQKHLISLLRATCPFTGGHLSSLNRLLSATTASSCSPHHFAIDDYLITTCHLSPTQALESCKCISHLKSPSNPNAVLAFLAELGLSATEIAVAIAADPKLLCAKVDKTLAPRAAQLLDLGFSRAQIARLVSLARIPFRRRSLVSKLHFWIPFFGSIEKLLYALKRNSYLFRYSIKTVVGPNISILQQCGLTACDIAKMFGASSRLLTTSSERVKAIVARAEELGVPRGVRMFRHAITTASCLSQETVVARMRFLMSLGWSEAEVALAVRRAPALLRTGDMKLQRAVGFWTKEVGLEPRHIARSPALLNYSFERRLIPRHYVMKVLKAKGLPGGHMSLCSVVPLTEKKFLERFVHPHKQKIPGLADAYAAACRQEVPTGVEL